MGAVDPLAVGMACALLATLFAHAALTKAADLPLLEQHLAAYGLPFSALAATALLGAGFFWVMFTWALGIPMPAGFF